MQRLHARRQVAQQPRVALASIEHVLKGGPLPARGRLARATVLSGGAHERGGCARDGAARGLFEQHVLRLLDVDGRRGRRRRQVDAHVGRRVGGSAVPLEVGLAVEEGGEPCCRGRLGQASELRHLGEQPRHLLSSQAHARAARRISTAYQHGVSARRISTAHQHGVSARRTRVTALSEAARSRGAVCLRACAARTCSRNQLRSSGSDGNGSGSTPVRSVAILSR